MKELDPLNIPLEGKNLIEASAGTGKTYTVTSLYLRLILEKGFSVNEILVVTFTKAATEELKGRIRSRLLQCRDAFKNGTHGDPFIAELAGNLGNPRSLLYLREAILHLDEAAIFTIHGFCQRMLNENAFETGQPFDTDFIENEDALRQGLAEDFWRKNVYDSPPEFIGYLLQKGIRPSKLLESIRAGLTHPEIEIIPAMKKPDLKDLEKFRRGIERLRKKWPLHRNEVGEILRTAELNGTRYGTTKKGPGSFSKRDLKVSSLLTDMDHLLSLRLGPFPLFKDFRKLTSSVINESVKKGKAVPEHELFHICEDLNKSAEALINECDQRILFLRTALLSYIKRNLPKEKDRTNKLSFGDLLHKIKEVIDDDGANAFLKKVRAKFKAALIDEFQDTDPVQYHIFSRIFDTGKRPLFLIGDPKQAIYGFRGADLFTYINASSKMENRYTLSSNWRSEKGLIKAINCIFSRAKRPFLFPEISFHTQRAAREKHPAPLLVEGRAEPAFRLCLIEPLEEMDNGKPVSKSEARERILAALGREISRLLSLGAKGKALLGKAPLREEHLAVLVRTNREAKMVRDMLSTLNIPSVLYSNSNLFDSPEAMDMQWILDAIGDPENESLIKRALTTRALGYTGEDLEQLGEDQNKWEPIRSRFRRYYRLWKMTGFLPMFRRFIVEEKIRRRLLSLPDGERRLTNLLHLAEVLYDASLKAGVGIKGLNKWLSSQTDSDSPRLEEHQLRLESDERAIMVVTVHKSKGLEYPVVFCPFLWDGSKTNDKTILFHDRKNDNRHILDLGSSDLDTNSALARQENLSEDLRLLYVALTRAKNRCYMVWGRIKGAQTSAPSYLYYEGPSIEEMEGLFAPLKKESLRKGLSLLEKSSGRNVGISHISRDSLTKKDAFPKLQEPERLSFRDFSGSISRQWRVSSFSYLISKRSFLTELPDHDELETISEEGEKALALSKEDTAASGIFSFPKGAKTGTFLHDLLEHLDFTSFNQAETGEIISKKLFQHGFGNDWKHTILEMLNALLSTSLNCPAGSFTLSDIRMEDRLNELEFYFPLKEITPSRLKEIFKGSAGSPPLEGMDEQIERLDFSPSKGFMRGFIDLVFKRGDLFFLVDWKSNFLGPKVEDYAPELLALEMRRNLYTLQYVIYTLALDQYLRQRLPGYRYEKNFGGVYYIFLRGIDRAKGSAYGIFRDLPTPAFINSLRKDLLDLSGLLPQ